MASFQERLNPNSPHYDPVFAEMRRKAYEAADAHEADMNDPAYRAEVAKARKPYR